MNLSLDDILEPLQKINKENFTKNDIEQFLKLIFTNKSIEEVNVNGVILNPNAYSIIIDGKEKLLPKKQFLVLCYLLKNPDRVISRFEFIKNCWEGDIIVGERTVDVHVCKIKKLVKGKIDIKTNKCYGYRWKAC